MKKTNSVSVLAVIITTTAIVGILSVTQQTVYTEGAYTRGYNNAVCDASNCHGYGYDPSCPSSHSGDYCSNYGQDMQLDGIVQAVVIVAITVNHKVQQLVAII
jgi:hypothetical protein